MKKAMISHFDKKLAKEKLGDRRGATLTFREEELVDLAFKAYNENQINSINLLSLLAIAANTCLKVLGLFYILNQIL